MSTRPLIMTAKLSKIPAAYSRRPMIGALFLSMSSFLGCAGLDEETSRSPKSHDFNPAAKAADHVFSRRDRSERGDRAGRESTATANFSRSDAATPTAPGRLPMGVSKHPIFTPSVQNQRDLSGGGDEDSSVLIGSQRISSQNLPDELGLMPMVFTLPLQMSVPDAMTAVQMSLPQRSASQGGYDRGVGLRLNADIYDGSAQLGRVISGSGGSSGAKTSPVMIQPMTFRGTFRQALDAMCSKAQVSWRWLPKSREVEIYRFEVKSYDIAALAGGVTTNSNVSMRGDGVGNSSTTAVSRQASVSRWTEINNMLMASMSSQGSMALMESSGMVTIRDTPGAHEQIKIMLEALNQQLMRQIYLNVDVFSVSMSESDNYGIDWNLINARTSGQFTYRGDGSIGTNTGALGVGILTGALTGTNVILNALSSIGKANIVNQFSLTTLNGQPVPLSINRKISYLAESETVPSTIAGQPPTTRWKSGELPSGINMTVTPKTQGNSGRLLLDLSLYMSDVESLRTVSNATQMMELPTWTTKSTAPQATLQSGQTLVLSGFKQQVNKASKTGILGWASWFLGGSSKSSNESQFLIIMITPQTSVSGSKSPRP